MSQLGWNLRNPSVTPGLGRPPQTSLPALEPYKLENFTQETKM